MRGGKEGQAEGMIPTGGRRRRRKHNSARGWGAISDGAH